MASYPGSLDALTNPGATSPRTNPAHHTQHSDANDILEALEGKLGIGATTPVINTRLYGSSTGGTTWRTASLPDVRDWGAACNNSTDDTAAVQAAITAVGTGALVIPGICAITGQLRIKTSDLKLIGYGQGHFHTTGSRLGKSGFRWIGGTYVAGDMDPYTMLLVSPDSGAGNVRLSGVEVVGLGFFGETNAARAICWRSTCNGKLDVYLEHTLGPALETNVVAALTESRDVQENLFLVEFLQSGASDGVGVLLDGGSGANTSENYFPQIVGRFEASDGLVFGNTDHNAVGFARLLSAAGGAGVGVRFKAHTSTPARYNVIHFLSASDSVIAEGTETAATASNNNVIGTFDKQAGAIADPTIGTGASLAWRSDAVPYSLVGHGWADHADVNRSFYLPAHTAKLDSGTAANLGASPQLTPVVALADAATQGCTWMFTLPHDYASGIVTITIFWVPGASDASSHAVRWSWTVKGLSAGSDVTSSTGAVTTPWTGASAARTINLQVVEAAQDIGIAAPTAAGEYRFTLQRIGADGADSYVGTVNVVGVRVLYTAAA